VEQVVIYNIPAHVTESEIAAMMERGREILGVIPGVHGVRTGKDLQNDGKYRYCWLIRFASEAVAEAYRSHPDHVRFADEVFRPMAADRITVDYEILN
jgi:fructose-bisphosphate aldolase class II